MQFRPGPKGHFLGMNLVSVALLPARAAVATAETALAIGAFVAPAGPLRRSGGYGDRLAVLLAEDGAIEQLGRLGDPEGPLARLEELLALTNEDRPLGRALAPGGALDRLTAEGGAVDRLAELPDVLGRLADLDDTLRRLGELGDTLRALGDLGTSLERLAKLADALERLSQSTEGLPELPQRVEAVERQVNGVAGQLHRIEPSLEALSAGVASLQDAARQLAGAVEPVARIAGRLPGGRRAARRAAEEEAAAANGHVDG